MDKLLEFTGNNTLLVLALVISFFVVAFTELRRKAGGLSADIDPPGQVSAALPPFGPAVLHHEAQPARWPQPHPEPGLAIVPDQAIAIGRPQALDAALGAFRHGHLPRSVIRSEILRLSRMINFHQNP